jgi:teichuronic acid exporter
VFYQRAAKRWAEGLGFGDIWRTTAIKLLAVGVPMYVIGGLTMPWIFPLILGHQWMEAGRFGAVLCIAAFLAFATSPMGWANVVVDVAWYGPMWMAMRFVTAAAVVVLAMTLKWTAWTFVVALVVQNSAMYLFDYWAKWRFSNRLPLAGKPV